jgi:hypothetical protein
MICFLKIGGNIWMREIETQSRREHEGSRRIHPLWTFVLFVLVFQKIIRSKPERFDKSVCSVNWYSGLLCKILHFNSIKPFRS